MTFAQFLLIIKARRKIAVQTLAVTVITALVLSLLLPKKYVASADVVVDVKSPDPIAGMVLPVMSMQGYMATQIDIINSHKVALKAIESQKFSQNAELLKQWRDATGGVGQFEDWLADTLAKRLTVKPSRESNLITISYRAPSADFAAAMANAFAQAYIDTTVDLRVTPAVQNSRWFKERLEVMRHDVDVAQQRLSDFRREHGIIGENIQRLDAETAKLNDLSAQLSMAMAQNADTGTKDGESRTSELPEVIQNPLIQTLKSNLATARAKLQDSSTTLGKNHPAYQQLEAQVTQLEAELNEQIRRISSSITVSNDLGKRKLITLQKESDDQKQRVIELNAQRDEMAVLQAAVDTAQRGLEAVTQRYVSTNLEAQSSVTNVSLLSAAVPPLSAAFPNIPLNLLLSLFVGGGLGIAMAFVLELLDRRVRGTQDLAAATSLPVLGTVQIGNPL